MINTFFFFEELNGRGGGIKGPYGCLSEQKNDYRIADRLWSYDVSLRFFFDDVQRKIGPRLAIEFISPDTENQPAVTNII